ncbi:amidohydrolase [Bryobacterales bacterium F-183]|nr:amidohydrolase [Bryobacterales bacterium F-183]
MRFAPALLLPALLLGQTADLILENGKFATVEKSGPATVQAVAVRDGKILALGTTAAMAKHKGPKTEVIDLKGAFGMPGFIEGHGHFTGLGAFKRSLNIRNAKTWNEIVGMVGAAAKEARPGQWIVGRGFHQSKWDTPPSPSVQGFPVHDELSKVSPNNPVILTHASGHATMVNAKALEMAGINKTTKDPEGGEILRDSNGNATGLLNERAQGLTRRAYNEYLAKRTPAEVEADDKLEVQLAANECLQKGITSFQDAGSNFRTVSFIKKMAESGELPLRLWMMLNVPVEDLEVDGSKYRWLGAGNGYLTVRAIKRAADGALGPRGAWLLEPYADLPDRSGMNTESIANMEKTAEWAINNGFQLCIHAIGDRGNREVLDIFERSFKKHPEKKNLRWRVEHAQHLSAQDIPRFGKLGVIAAMQGVHCTSDAPYVLARLGAKRAEEGAYVWRKLLDSGAVIANGTDAPVEDVDPLPSFYASVSRKLADGTKFYPAQNMTRMEALRSYTLDAAFAAFEEQEKGSLKVGKFADITVLSKDILTVPEDDILKTEVLYTIVGGKVRYKRK